MFALSTKLPRFRVADPEVPRWPLEWDVVMLKPAEKRSDMFRLS